MTAGSTVASPGARLLDVTLSLCGSRDPLAVAPWVPLAFGRGPSDRAYVIFSHIAFAQGAGVAHLHERSPRFLRFPTATVPLRTLLLGNAAVAAIVALLLYHLAGRA
jgi:hypothetical protein